MKKIEEMTNDELQNALDVMSGMVEAKATVEKIKTELNKREAEAEAKRKAEEAKRAAEAAKQDAEVEKTELTLVNKQKSVLGKYYKKVFYDTHYLVPTVHYTVYYKVTGVYDDKVVVSFIKKYEYSNIVSKAVTFININELLNNGNHYEEISRKEFNDEYAKSNLTINSLTDVFNKFFEFPF